MGHASTPAQLQQRLARKGRPGAVPGTAGFWALDVSPCAPQWCDCRARGGLLRAWMAFVCVQCLCLKGDPSAFVVEHALAWMACACRRACASLKRSSYAPSANRRLSWACMQGRHARLTGLVAVARPILQVESKRSSLSRGVLGCIQAACLPAAALLISSAEAKESYATAPVQVASMRCMSHCLLSASRGHQCISFSLL